MKADRNSAANLAEAVLRIVAQPSEAASIAGDLLEHSERNPARFILDLITTLLWLGAAAIATLPRHAAALLLAAAALWSSAYVAVRIVFAELGWLALVDHASTGIVAAGMRGILLAAALVLASAATGIALAAFVRTVRLNPALPLAGLFTVLGPVFALSDLLVGQLTWYCLLTYLLVLPLCYAVPLLTAAELTRGLLESDA